MKLGEMLVRDGRITPAQLDAAIAQQARVGGRVGTVMMEMRLIDAETLTVYLGLELGIPIASKAALDRAKRAAVRLLTPELAERFLCVPIVVQDRQLIAALRDPHDLLALDELASATGYRIIPRVAPEVRLYYYLERYYGVPRPDRYRRLGELAASVVQPGREYVEPPAPPLPGLPPQSRKLVVAPPMPAPPLRAVPSDPPPIEDELVVELDADEGEIAEEAPTAPAIAAAAAGTSKKKRGGDKAEAIALAEAVARMEKATSRAEVLDAIFAHAHSLFEVVALLVVRDGLALGWRGYGPELDQDRIEALMVPLEVSSVFKQAVETGEVYAGLVPPTALHAHVFKVLRAEPPRQAVVVPISIKDRLVNLLYGQRNGDEELTARALDGLRTLAAAASEAYVRLIALQKQAG